MSERLRPKKVENAIRQENASALSKMGSKGARAANENRTKKQAEEDAYKTEMEERRLAEAREMAEARHDHLLPPEEGGDEEL
ncbi:MAG: hypothetical protein KGI78_02980 [Patescibacteria group bacterium]|nr:hypothetical protein [Patescibacteria group bacterium]MDE1944025.1 hypothetical protein [Patescibacteria group bacterium]MDE2057793.1 hypothetical protein [Patescibacteria group bacterium]